METSGADAQNLHKGESEEIMNTTQAIYFSPTGSTETVVKTIANEFGSYKEIDLSKRDLPESYAFTKPLILDGREYMFFQESHRKYLKDLSQRTKPCGMYIEQIYKDGRLMISNLVKQFMHYSMRCKAEVMKK